MDNCMVCGNLLDGTSLSSTQRQDIQNRRHNLFLSSLNRLNNHSNREITLENFLRNFCCSECANKHTLGNLDIFITLENEIIKAKIAMVEREQSTQIAPPRGQISYRSVPQSNPFSGTQIPANLISPRTFRPSPFVNTVSRGYPAVNVPFTPRTYAQANVTEDPTVIHGTYTQGRTIVPGTSFAPATSTLSLPPFMHAPETVSQPFRVPIDGTVIPDIFVQPLQQNYNTLNSNNTESSSVFPPPLASASYWPQHMSLPEFTFQYNFIPGVPPPLQEKRIIGAYRIYEDLMGTCSICLEPFQEHPRESRTVPLPNECRTVPFHIEYKRPFQNFSKDFKKIATICGHAFHEKCLITALERKNGCPKCRNEKIKIV